MTSGADPGFQVRGGVLKKIVPRGGRREIVGVFRVKNYDFTQTNHIFPIAEEGANIFGVFRVKNHNFTPKNHIFSTPGPLFVDF
jgi:lipoprotein NlpI